MFFRAPRRSPSCQPADGGCRSRQPGHFLESASLYPPQAALRRFPRRPLQKEHPIRQDGVFFLEMCRSTGELAASTCAKRVKSRGEAGFLRMATAIRGVPGSEFEPRRPLQKHHPIGWCFFVRLGAHRRVSRLTAAAAADSRDTSSKAPRFIRRRRRFGAFLVARSKKNTPSDRMGYSFWNVPQHRRVCAMRRLSNRRWRGKLKKVGRDAP